MLNKIKVFNLESPRTSKPVANQFVIETPEGKYFQSYNSVIAFIPSPSAKPLPTVIDPVYWNYSVTTRKYRNIFLGEHTQETQAKIDNGTYVFCSLN